MSETVDDVGGRPRKYPRAKLAKFIDDAGGTKKMAKKLDISIPHLNKLARGAALPSFEVLQKIIDATNGYIDADYFSK